MSFSDTLWVSKVGDSLVLAFWGHYISCFEAHILKTIANKGSTFWHSQNAKAYETLHTRASVQNMGVFANGEL